MERRDGHQHMLQCRASWVSPRLLKRSTYSEAGCVLVTVVCCADANINKKYIQAQLTAAAEGSTVAEECFGSVRTVRLPSLHRAHMSRICAQQLAHGRIVLIADSGCSAVAGR